MQMSRWGRPRPLPASGQAGQGVRMRVPRPTPFHIAPALAGHTYCKLYDARFQSRKHERVRDCEGSQPLSVG